MTTLEYRWRASYDANVRRHLNYPTGSLVDEFDKAMNTYAAKPGVTDLAATRAFYETVFGWGFTDYKAVYSGSIVERPQMEPGARWFECIDPSRIRRHAGV